MLWMTLWKRLGKQPMTLTNHYHIKAVIDGRAIAMDMKFDASGKPYLIPDPKHDPNKSY